MRSEAAFRLVSVDAFRLTAITVSNRAPVDDHAPDQPVHSRGLGATL